MGVLGMKNTSQVLTGQRTRRPCHQRLDGVGQVRVGDIVVAAGGADEMRLQQDLGVGDADRRLELVAGQLQQLAQRIAEVDGIHEAAINGAAVADAALVQAGRNLGIDGVADDKGQVVEVADALRVGRRIRAGATRG